MARIVYLAFPIRGIYGGQKMIIRHVETLRELGFDAVWWNNTQGRPPTWFEFDVPREVNRPFRPDDILVVPSDAPTALATLAAGDHRVIVFEQNQFSFAAMAYEAIDQFPADRRPTFIAVGQTNAASIRRAYPEARIEIVPCFADERLFRPGAVREDAIAYAPRKRMREGHMIRAFFRRVHPRHAALPWSELTRAPEREVARTFAASSLYLSLSRFESVGMTTLEAMACGCICAGFTGVGGREYATTANGFWVADDDCEAAADALAQAADLVQTGGPALRRCREAAQDTARQWSYERFRVALEEVWERLAPQARTLELRVRSS
jgi:hypothetical protein